jgi:hypothetical protein
MMLNTFANNGNRKQLEGEKLANRIGKVGYLHSPSMSTIRSNFAANKN